MNFKSGTLWLAVEFAIMMKVKFTFTCHSAGGINSTRRSVAIGGRLGSAVVLLNLSANAAQTYFC